MYGEVVRLRLDHSGRVSVHVIYQIRGRAPRAVHMAFPETDWFRLDHFRARWNRRELAVERRLPPKDTRFRLGAVDCPALFTFEVPAASGAAHTLENLYTYVPPRFAPGKDDDYFGTSGRYVEYILRTGALWEGVIGSVRVEFDTGGVSCSRLAVLHGGYAGRCESERMWLFQARDIEPDRDIRLVIVDAPGPS